MDRHLHPLLLVLALTLAAGPARAQDGTVRGAAWSGDSATVTGEPVAYALVSLRRQDVERPSRSTLTREDGAFQFTGVEPGVYRLRLERIGYQERWSDSLYVGPGQTVEWSFRGGERAITIEGVSSATACYTTRELERDAELARLWREAQKGVETKRVFDVEHRYPFVLQQLTYVEAGGRGLLTTRSVDSLTRVFANDPAHPPRRARGGWGTVRRGQMDFALPDGTEILDEAFLAENCVESGFEAVDGSWEFQFRPLRAARNGVDLRGTVRVEQGTFQLKSMKVEYLRRGRPLLEATIFYQDVPVPGATLRLPSIVFFTVQDPARLARGIQRVEGRAVFAGYGPFERAAP